MTRNLRLALVSAFPPGPLSLNEYGYHLAVNLAADPNVAEVIVLADRMAAPQAELDLGPKIRVVRVWDFNALATPVGLIRALRRERPDGVVYNLQMATFGDREAPAALGLLAPMLSRLTGTPSGIIAHNIIAGVDLELTHLKGQKLRQWLVRTAGSVITRAMMSANYVTTTLQSYAEILGPAYPRADISVLPHGTFDTTERTWLPVTTRPRRIATMGKFGTYKRLETLLAAFDLLREDPQFGDVKLVIGGMDHPNMQGYVASLAEARRDDDGVVFHGYVAENAVPEFFEAARLSVFDYESTTGSSGVLHQTASYGAVPIFPHIGDFVELCQHEGLTGLHYAPGNPVDMAAAIRQGLLDEAGAEQIALSNRDAALGMPFSQVVAFHVEKLIAYGAGSKARQAP